MQGATKTQDVFQITTATEENVQSTYQEVTATVESNSLLTYTY
mgnify:FL=1